MKNLLPKNNFPLRPVIAALLLMGVHYSCMKDLGNYDYNAINEIGITSTTTDSFVIRQSDTLKIDINVSQSLAGANVTYLWSMIQYTATSANPAQYQLATTKILKALITVLPGLYKVVVKATDNQTGVSFFKYFPVSVEPAEWAGEGWLVLQDQNATQGGRDISIILSRDGATHGKVYNNLYFNANKRKLPATTNYMSVINYQAGLNFQKLMFGYQQGATEVKAIDYTDSSYADSWFLVPPTNTNIQADYTVDGAQREILFNNNQLYYRIVNLVTTKTPPMLFNAPLLGTWELSPFVMQYIILPKIQTIGLVNNFD